MIIDIPQFPRFREIVIQDKIYFNDILSGGWNELSEYTFTNIYAWRKYYGFKIALYGNVILLKTDSIGGNIFFMPLSVSIEDAVSVVCDMALDGNTFIRVSEYVAGLAREKNSNLEVVEDRDNFDYLYEMDDLRSLKGKKYDGKRNHIRKFKKRYEYDYFKLDNNAQDDILAFEEEWCDIKGCDKDHGLSGEREAYIDIAAYMDVLNVSAGGIRVDGRLAAVAFGECLNKDTLVIHVLKARAEYAGLYQVINNEFLLNEGGKCSLVNMEQDLGNSGLRKAKESYHPIRFVKKYIIRGQGA